jgi:hypothetical protein
LTVFSELKRARLKCADWFGGLGSKTPDALLAGSLDQQQLFCLEMLNWA